MELACHFPNPTISASDFLKKDLNVDNQSIKENFRVMKSSFITFLLIFFLCAKGDTPIGEEESRQYKGSKDSDNSCYGDLESLSSDSSEQTSGSKGDLSEMFSKGNIQNNLLKLFIHVCRPRRIP